MFVICVFEATGCDVKEDEEDRASILSLDSDSTSGPFFWYRVIAKHFPKVTESAVPLFLLLID